MPPDDRPAVSPDAAQFATGMPSTAAAAAYAGEFAGAVQGASLDAVQATGAIDDVLRPAPSPRRRKANELPIVQRSRHWAVFATVGLAGLFLSVGGFVLTNHQGSQNLASQNNPAAESKFVAALPVKNQTLTVNAKLEVNNESQLNGDLKVQGDGDYTGTVRADNIRTSVLQVTGNSNFSGNLSVDGISGSTITITGNGNFSGSLNVSGPIQGSSVNASTYSVNGTAGAAVTCASGQYLSAAQVKSGLVIGGSCATPAGSTPLPGDLAYADQANTFSASNNFTGTLQHNGFDVCDSSGNCGGGGGSGTPANAFVQSGNSFGADAYLGTNDAYGLVLQTNGTARMQIGASGGITVTGALSATNFSGNGSGLTSVNAATLGGNNSAYYTNASNISTGTLANARLSTSVTLQGNTFNGASQLVQLSATGALPAVSGAAVTNVNAASLQGNTAAYFTNASNISAGTLADARLSTNVALLNGSNNFTGTLQHNGSDICDASGNCSSGITKVDSLNGMSGAVTVQGTTNQVVVTNNAAAKTITLSLPQSIDSAATPTFGGLTLSAALGVGSGGTGATSFTANGVLYGNGTGSLQATAVGTTGQCLVGNTGAAPSWASCTSAAGGAAPGGAAGGDLSGTYPNPTIGKLQGVSLATSSVTSGQVLQYNGTSWVNQSLSGDVTLNGTGVATIGSGKVTNAKLANSSLSITAGTGLTGGGTVSLGGSTALGLATTGVTAGSYGSSGNVATFTVNAQGQLTVAGSTAIAIDTSQVASGTLGAARGGTGVDGSAAANGQLLIGNGSGFTLAALTQGSGISITNSAGGITLAVDNTVCTTAGNCSVGSGVGAGDTFMQGGNAFGATAVLGTTDANPVNFVTGGTTALALTTTGDAAIRGSLTVQGSGSSSFTGTVSGADATTTNQFVTLGQLNTGLSSAGVTTVGALDGGTANANGAAISGNTLYLQSASGTMPGLVTTAAQTFAGAKTFSGVVGIGTAPGASVALNIAVAGTDNALTARSAATTLSISSTGSGANAAIAVSNSNNGYGIYSSSTSGIGVAAVSTNSTALYVSSIGSISGFFQTGNGSGTNTNATVVDRLGTSQTADLLQFQNSGGAVLSGIDSGGKFYLKNGSFQVSFGTVTQANSVALTIPADANVTDTLCLQTLANCGGSLTVGVLDGGTANANGATISSGTLYLQSASGTMPGLVNTAAQTFAGNKTFSGSVFTSNLDTAAAGVLALGATNATAINLNQNTVIAQGKILSVGTAGTVAGQLYVSGSAPASSLSTTNLVAGALNMVVKDGYAYVVTNGATASLAIYDISNPSSPGLVGSVSLGGNGYGTNLTVKGRYAYLVFRGNSNANTLMVVDISTPTAPTVVGTVSGFDTSSITSAYVAVSGGLVYVAYATSGVAHTSLAVFDVANVSAPSLKSLTNIGGNVGASSITMSGAYVYITSSSTTTGKGLYIYNVSNPSAPVLAGSAHDNSSTSHYEAVAVQDRYAYALDAIGGVIDIYDISTPTAPVLVKSMTSGLNSTASSLVIQGRMLYGLDNSSLRAFDISNPAAAAPVWTTASTSSSRMTVQGRYAFVLTSSPQLRAFDVGGAYIQQFEAGGSQVGTQSVRTDLTVGGSASIQGGLNVGQSVAMGNGAAIRSAAAGMTTLLLQASASQTADLLDMNNNAGALVAGFSAAGNLTFGQSSTIGTISISTASGTGYGLTLQAGNETGTTSTGGSVSIDAGSGTTANGSISIGATNAAAINLGNTTKTATVTVKTNGTSTTAFQIQNANGLGLLTADTKNNRISVGGPQILYTNPNWSGGSFSLGTQSTYGTSTKPEGVGAADFNGDGYADLAVVTYGATNGTGNLQVYMNNGDGTFGAASTTALSSFYQATFVRTADLNGDGHPDIAVSVLTSNSICVFLNKGNGTFNTASCYSGTNQQREFSLVDMNGDGHPDIVSVDGGTSKVNVFMNNGNGTFAGVVYYPADSGTYGIATGDINGDGHPDAVAVNRTSNDVSVLLNSGSGSLGTATNYPTGGTNSQSVALADVNGDGHLDLVTANYGSANVSLLLGDGSGAFGSATTYTVGTNPYNIEMVDMNGDGHPDIVVSNYGSGTVSILLNQGTGTFGAANSFGVGSGPQQVDATDVNADGKPDILVANSSANTASVILNTSGGGASYRPTLSVTSTTSSEGGLYIQGASGQTANLFVIQSSDGTQYLSVDASGNLAVNGSSHVTSGNASLVAAVIQGYAGQSADLLDLQNSAGNTLSKFNSNGDLQIGGTSSAASATAFQVQDTTGAAVLSVNTSTATLSVKNVIITASLTVNGHIISGNSSGTTTAVAGADAGSGATMSISGNDTSGKIVITTGTGSVAGDLADIAFANAYGAAPNVVLTAGDYDGASLQVYVVPTATGFSINARAGGGLADGLPYTFYYHVIQ